MPDLLPRARSSQESVFAKMSRLAAQHGAVNLGQGFPSGSPPAFLLEAARRAIGTADQYAPPAGLSTLRGALGTDLGVDGDDVVVTTGATEAMGLLAQALYGPGDEVVMFDPVFDIYLPQARLAGATPVTVPLHLKEGEGWTLDLAELRAAVTPRTRALLLNSPHNPTGRVFSRAELEAIALLARQHDLWIISDEVYDELYFGQRPVNVRTLAPERTFTVGSAGKRLEVTGWRIGWVACPAGLSGKIAALRQIASFCAPTPFQVAVASALPVARETGFYEDLREGYAARLRLLAHGLRELGAQVHEPGGTYFLIARRPGWDAEALVVEAGVAVIPGSAFMAAQPAPEGLFRLAFCKSEAELKEALGRLERFTTGERRPLARHQP
ncbi:pyridoxal phosphate-dependent aminotransferase [Deinococcus hopiensis]|uniref:N-succinyldiaminopimelate aminotransferase n=1 Tax=Deinococcus hopiensis KR-140 TaxID=695939 RepID=A0A1W1VR21_9DEIO|nr:aminotransferase class I/II-fold pyridoxal phosphate-dependent enzyme [Deinococcus hopiensis]SMB95798.1 N-succinyldiaminopimelate aminotransferase [Deinococcus hopiensis KR-140]